MTTSKSTKRALLSSILAMVLCVAMLVGTTFAWFTDRVTSGNNRIAAGNLDVELYHGANLDETVNGTTGLFTNADGTDITWEPGVIAYENFKVVNAGSLALKYQLSMNIIDYNTVNGKSLADVLKVAVLEDDTFDGNRADAQALTFDKTLSDFVKEGSLTAGAEDTYAVVIYWEPGANDDDYNLNNGKTSSDGEPLFIDLGITLTATQEMEESDSFDNRYDADAYYADAYVSDFAELAAALGSAQEGDVIAIEDSIELTAALTVPAGVTMVGRNDAVIAVPTDIAQPITLSQGAKLENLGFTVPAFASGEVNIVYMMENASVTGCTFTGAFAGGNEVSRGIAVAPGAKNVKIANNTFDALRQPAYINNEAAGTVTNNTVTGTKGFVVCSDSKVEFADNTFFGNVVDIAIIASNTAVDNYTDVAAISAANNYAYVENQVSGESSAEPVVATDTAALTEALSQAQPGDVIALDPAVTYEGSFEMKNGVILNGNGAAFTYDGNALTGSINVANADSPVTIHNCVFEGYVGVHITPGADDVTITDCIFDTDNRSLWINGGNTGNITIRGCTMKKNSNIEGANNTVSNLLIEENTFDTGIGVWGLSLNGSLHNVTIRNNTYNQNASVGSWIDGGGLARVYINNYPFDFQDVVFEGNKTASTNGSMIGFSGDDAKAAFDAAIANGSVSGVTADADGNYAQA